MRNQNKFAVSAIFLMIFSCGRLRDLAKGREGGDADEEVRTSKNYAMLDTYKNCDDLNENLSQQFKSYRQEEGGDQQDVQPVNAPGTTSPGSADGANPRSVSATNVQEMGIDEADLLKVGKTHFYVVNRSGIHLIDRQSFKEVGVIETTGFFNTTIYAYDERLIVIGGRSDASLSSTVVRSYAIDAGKSPALEKERTFKGNLLDSRLKEKHLIMVLDSSMSRPTESTFATLGKGSRAFSVVTNEDRVNDVNCSRVVRAPYFEGEFPSLMLQEIINIATDDPEREPQIIATHNASSGLYMGQNSLYLYRNGGSFGGNSTVITKVIFKEDSGEPMVVARGTVNGYVKDQWAFHEYGDQDVLAVATTFGHVSRSIQEGQPTSSNHLMLLEQQSGDLKIKSEVDPYGENEDIRAVRYIGSMAYVVTFKKTDPLFAFDLSDVSHPVLLGDLKIPGFSVYMHPLPENHMIGIGFDALDMGDFAWFQGLQVSLFDVSNPKDMKRIDNHIVGARGSSSEVTSDHHAFFANPDRNIFAIPAIELEKSDSNRGDSAYGDVLKFSGAILYGIDGAALKESGRVSHQDLMGPACVNRLKSGRWWQDTQGSYDINRVVVLDDHLYSVSRFGIKRHALEAPFASDSTVAFADISNECASAPEY